MAIAKTRNITNTYLKKSMPVDESLMTLNIAMDSTVVMGFSSTRPISNNETSKGQKQNRREAFIF